MGFKRADIAHLWLAPPWCVIHQWPICLLEHWLCHALADALTAPSSILTFWMCLYRCKILPSQKGMLPPLSIYYSLLLFTLPLSFCPPSSFWQTALSCFIQSSLVCPSIHPPRHGGLLMPDLAARTSLTTRWEDLLIDPALSRHAGHAEKPHNRVNRGGKFFWFLYLRSTCNSIYR